jgi:hypothetical protein
LDYEQLPFKCKYCHGHGHFAKHCKKKADDQTDKPIEEQWTVVQKNGHQKKGTGKRHATGGLGSTKSTQEKDAATKEPEIPQNNTAGVTKENQAHTEDPPINEEEGAPKQVEASQGTPPNPSYAEITKKKHVDSAGSSEDETFERSSKRAGRKSRKELREEEAERLKVQGSQSTIEMSMGRNTRSRPTKGGPSPSS